MTKEYPLAGESPARLQLRFEQSKILILLDGVQQAVLSNAAERKRGWTTTLEDGSTLEYRWMRRLLLHEPAVLRNGKHIDSSPSHPAAMLRSASNGLFFLVALIIIPPFLRDARPDWLQWIFAAFYLIGAFLLRSGRRLGVALIALPLFIDLDLVVFAAITQSVAKSWLFTRVAGDLLFGQFAVRAYLAADDLRRSR